MLKAINGGNPISVGLLPVGQRQLARVLRLQAPAGTPDTHSSRPRLAQEQHQRHTGETQERHQHEAILIGRDGCLLFEMLLYQHLYLCFPQLPKRAGLLHQLAHRGKNFPPAQ